MAFHRNALQFSITSTSTSTSTNAKLKLREGAHRERPHSFHFHRHGEEARTSLRKRGQTAEMLYDRNAGSKQDGMNRPCSVIGGINVERVDADERDAGADQLFRQVAGEMGMSFEITIGAPVRIPSRVDQQRFSLQ